MTQPPLLPERLAGGLVARLLHDLSGPASGIISGLDLQSGPAEFREDATALVADSARALIDMLAFHQVAFAGGAGSQDSAQVALLAETQFKGRRSKMEISLPDRALQPKEAQATLIVSHLASGCLPLGGVARLTGAAEANAYALRLAATGPRAELGAEVAAGLAGKPCPEGMAGRWAPALYLNALVTAGGGRVEAEAFSGGVRLSVHLPT